MGFSNSWIAVRCSEDEAIKNLKITYVSKPDDSGFPIHGAEISGALLPDGWMLFFFNSCDHPFTYDAFLRRLSSTADVLICIIEEHAMACAAGKYSNGILEWYVTHEAEKGIFNLSIQGNPPTFFHALKEKIFAEQDSEGGENADVNLVFDLPVQLLQELCGFRYDHYKFSWGSPNFCEFKRGNKKDKG